MSKADNKELEEATKVLQKLKKEMDKIFNITYINNTKERRAIETVLKELERLQEDYIEKDKIRELIKNKSFDICQVKLIRVKDLEELLERK